MNYQSFKSHVIFTAFKPSSGRKSAKDSCFFEGLLIADSLAPVTPAYFKFESSLATFNRKGFIKGYIKKGV